MARVYLLVKNASMLSSFFCLGTLVGTITATDADKANCSHSKVSYSIHKQEPYNGTDLFYIDRDTGSIYVKENTLDREVRQITGGNILL